jgi:hypothetical protein
MTTDNRTSVFIEDQFPLFARLSGQKLIQFIKRYYESQEQANNYIEVVHSLLDYQDIDTSPEDYFDYIAREIIPSIPERLIANRDLLAKHIKEVYKVRGSPVGYRIFFRALFGEEIEIYNPGDDLLRASDGRWVQEVAIKVEYVVNGEPSDLPGVRLIGESSGSSAIVNRIELIEDQGVKLYLVYLINRIGEFELGERLTSSDGKLSVDLQPADVGPVLSVAMTADGGYGHEVGDRVSLTGDGSGTGGQATVLTTRADSAVEFFVANGGSGYAVGTIVSTSNEPQVIGGSGQEASFIVSQVGPPFVSYPIFDDFIEYALDVVPSQSNTGANVTFVQAYDSNCTFDATSNTILKTGHGFEDNDVVRFFFITGNTQYIGVDDNVSGYTGPGSSFTVNTSANSYVVTDSTPNTFKVKDGLFFGVRQEIFEGGPGIHGRVSRMTANLALSNVNSTIVTALGTSIVNTGTITSVTTTDSGFGYNPLRPIGRVRYGFLADQQIANNAGLPGGVLGFNADIQTVYRSGTIASVRVDIQGDNYVTGNEVTLDNLTREQTESGVGITTSSSIIQFLGRYTDTKGWLSWDKYLQDNYYYQEFSYEIRSDQNLTSYRDTALNTMHPAGMKLFGGVYLSDTLDQTIEEDNEILIKFEILNANLSIEVSKPSINTIALAQVTSNTGDTISSNNNIFQNVQANDKVEITGSYLSDGVYIVKSAIDSNTISVFDTRRTVKLSPSLHQDVGFGFAAGNVIIANTSIRGVANVGDTINISKAINKQNNGGPFLITNKVGSNVVVQTYYGGNVTPFVAYTGDKNAKISIDRNFAFLANTNANVTFTATGNLVTRNSHEFSNNDNVIFYNIANTSAANINIVDGTTYYVLNTMMNTFQIAANSTTNTVINIQSDGTARLEANTYNIVISRYANTYPFSNTTVL